MGICGPETEGENETYINQQRQYQTSLHRPTLYAGFSRKTVKNIQTTRCQCVPQTREHSTLHPRTPERQDAERQEVWGHIYEITCDQDPAHVYIGETKRPHGKRFKEHTNVTLPTGVGDHCNATRNSVSLNNTKVLIRELQRTERKVKEAIYIKKNAPSMNREQGYQLPPIYHQLLLREQFPRRKTSRDQDF